MKTIRVLINFHGMNHTLMGILTFYCEIRVADLQAMLKDKFM
jgi:hypothetical protein